MSAQQNRLLEANSERVRRAAILGLRATWNLFLSNQSVLSGSPTPSAFSSIKVMCGITPLAENLSHSASQNLLCLLIK